VIHRHVIRIKPQLLPGQIQHNLQRRPVPSRHHRRIRHLPTDKPGAPSLNRRTVNTRSLSLAALVTRSLGTLGSVFALPFGSSLVLGNILAGTGAQLGLSSTRRGVSSTQRELGTISFRLSVIRTRLGSISSRLSVTFRLGGLRLSVIGRGLSNIGSELSNISFGSGSLRLSVIGRVLDTFGSELRSITFGSRVISLSVIRPVLDSITFGSGGFSLSVIRPVLDSITFGSGVISLSGIKRGPGSIQCRLDRIRCDLRSTSYGPGIGLGFGCVRIGSRRFDRRELDGVGVCLVG
jgi:hypothetical protein